MLKQNRIINEKTLNQIVFPALLMMAVGIAIALNFRMTSTHELWRDEAQSWLIARDTPISQLIPVLSHEGHPFLWYALLMPFARLGFPYASINWISCAVMTVAIVLIATRAPFGILGRVATVYGICLYWYACFARSYCLSVLFIVLICCCRDTRFQRPVRYCALIALLIQTHVLMIGLAFVLSAEYVIGAAVRWVRERRSSGRSVATLAKALLPALFPLISAFFLLFQLQYVSESSFSTVVMPTICVQLFVDVWHWVCVTFNMLLGELWPVALALLVLLLVLGAAFRRGRIAVNMLMLFCVLLVMHVMFAYYVYPLIYRALFVLFVILWAMWACAEDIRGDADLTLRRIVGGIIASVLIFDGACCFVIQWPMMKSDMSIPFSNAAEAGHAINSLPEDAIVVELSEDYCNSVLPYLKDRTVYNPFSQTPASFMRWDSSLRHEMTWDELLDSCGEMFPQAGHIVLLYCIGTEYVTEVPFSELPLTYHTNPYSIYGENYELYDLNLTKYRLELALRRFNDGLHEISRLIDRVSGRPGVRGPRRTPANNLSRRGIA